MIIDLILDRKAGIPYIPKSFYDSIVRYTQYGDRASAVAIAEALDSGTEADVKKALKRYLVDNDYNLEIATYIDSVNWL